MSLSTYYLPEFGRHFERLRRRRRRRRRGCHLNIYRDSVPKLSRTRPQAIPLAMITMRKFIDGFPEIFIYGMLMGLRLAALRRSSAMIDGSFGNVSAGVLFSKVAYQFLEESGN